MSTPGSLLKHRLEQLTLAPLKPQQRVYLLVNHQIPRLLHVLVLGKVYRTSLSRMDRRIRVALRKWVRLPHDTLDAILYAEVVRGGLGIPELSTAVRFSKQVRLDKLMSSCDPIVQAAARLDYVRRDVVYWFGPARVRRAAVSNRSDARNAWSQAMLRTMAGMGHTSSNEYTKTNRWILSGGNLLTGGDYRKGIMVRSNALSIPERRARGKPCNNQVSDCCRSTEPLDHISQVCPRTRGVRIRRRNDVARYTPNRLRKRGFTIVEEPRLPMPGGGGGGF